ncbi:MAG: MBL fold metallo-hydrolase [Thermoleophilaceae bacterium]
MDVRMFTVGMVQENCYLFRRDGSDRAVIVDPGEEAPRLLGAIDELGVQLEAILLTHTHFDHVGAVAPVAKATGAAVWVPELEKPVLSDINSYVPWAEFGPYESWDAEHTVSGGERLSLAGFEIDVLFTPGHSPGHVTYSIAGETPVRCSPEQRSGCAPPHDAAVFSGDVLFQGSVGRVDLPGGDWPTLLGSIGTLMDTLPPETTVYPGHMGVTTLGAERASNPFLAELAR